MYGKYTVNLGVYIREVYAITNSSSPPAFCQDYHCELRVRLGDLASPPRDLWWSLDANRSSEEMASLLGRALEVWFPQFSTRDQLLAIDASRSQPLGWPVRGGMVQAIVCAHRGDRERSRATLQKYWNDYKVGGVNRGHGDYIREIASRLGIDLDAP